MNAKLSDRVAHAAEQARRHARSFPGSMPKDRLPWAVIEAFDADIRGNVERDRQIEDERDRVLIAAVKLAETQADEAEEVAEAREHLIDAIDYLEQAVVRFGMVNRQGTKLGLAG